MKTTPSQDYAEFLRRMYAREVRAQLKLHNIARFLVFYAIAGAAIAAIFIIF